MKVEWQYLLLLSVSIIFGIYYFHFGVIEVSAVHILFLLGGGILTAVAFIVTDLVGKPMEIGSLKASHFTLQTAIGNLVLGFPVLIGAPTVRIIQLKPTEILVATASEEFFRVGAAIWLGEMFGKGFGLVMSGIVFAAMHMFWYPEQWFFAIFGGVLLSGLLYMYESQTACILTHWWYDLLVLGWIAPSIFLTLSIIMGITGYILLRGEK